MEEKLLFQYDGLIKILDFSPPQIEKAVQLYLHKDEKKVKEVLKVVKEENQQELAQKPLFLYVICTNFHNLKDYFPINEAIIMKILTEAWIKHDVLTKRDLADAARRKTIMERQRISEILAVAQYEKNKTIAIT